MAKMCRMRLLGGAVPSLLLAAAALLLAFAASADAQRPVYGPGKEPGPNGRVVPCRRGYSKRGTGNYKCLLCNLRSTDYQPLIGQSGCLTCPLDGGKVDKTRTQCIPRAGYTVGNSRNPVVRCPAGTAKGTLSFTKCTPCNRGAQYQPFAASTACLTCVGRVTSDRRGCEAIPGYQPGPRGSEPCPRGTAKPGAGNTLCRPCNGERQYQPAFGRRSCEFCPRGIVTKDRISCIAGPGYQPGPGPFPEPCPRGTAKSGTFNGICTRCAGTGARGGQRFSPNRGATDCAECQPGGTVSSDRITCTPPESPPPPEAGSPPPDTPPPEAGSPPPEAGSPPPSSPPPADSTPPPDASTPPPPDAATPPPPDAATPPPPDAATPPPPDASTPPPPDAATPPPPDAATPPPPDASTPPPPDAATPPPPDAATPPPPDAATPPPPDAATPPPDVPPPDVPPPDIPPPPIGR